MKRHVKIYFSFFGFGIDDFVPCEKCGKRANDIHHIDSRGMGGDPNGDKDVIGNLMALCRRCHTIYGDIVAFVDMLVKTHEEYISMRKR